MMRTLRASCAWSDRSGRRRRGRRRPLGRRLDLGSRPAGRPTTTSRSTSSTDRSAASPACRCCGRSAACCRRTGCSRRCRRSAATSCRAATRRSASSSSPGTICRSACRAAAGSASIRSASTARSATPAPCATRPTLTPRVVLGMPAHQLDLQRFVEFVLDCTLDNRTDRRSACSGRLPQRRAGRRSFERAAAPRRADRSAEDPDARRCATASRRSSRDERAALGPRPRGHVQSLQGDSVQLAARPAAARRS